MKQYGMNKATEFTRKQIGVVYSKAKSGELKIEKWVMSELYNLADYYAPDSNGGVEFQERFVLNILRSVFENNLEEAQAYVEQFADYTFKCYTESYQQKLDRSQYVA